MHNKRRIENVLWAQEKKRKKMKLQLYWRHQDGCNPFKWPHYRLGKKIYWFVFSLNRDAKEENIFQKLTKRKCHDEKCESNPNKKLMLILTFALCVIMMVARRFVEMK